MLIKVVPVKWWRPEAEDAEKPVEVPVALRKWSMLKLLVLSDACGEIGQLLGDDFSLERGMSAPKIASLVQALGEKAIRKAAELIVQSAIKPKGLTVEQVLEWDMDDFVHVLTEIIDMNFSEDTRKNFSGLRDVFVARFLRAAKEAPVTGLRAAKQNSATAPTPA